MKTTTVAHKQLDLIPYFPFYLGCKCVTPEGIDVLKGVYQNSTPVFYNTVKDVPYSKVIPMLRPLDQIKPEEATELGRIFFQNAEEEFDISVFKKEQFIKLVSKSKGAGMLLLDWSNNGVRVDELDQYGVPVLSEGSLTDALAYLMQQKFWVFSYEYFEKGLVVPLIKS